MRSTVRRIGGFGLAFASALAAASHVCAGDLEDKGKALLIKSCERCHAIGAAGDSKHPQAPPFRQVVTRYPLDNLAEALAEGIVSGHPDMPEFAFSPTEIDGILAYLDTLKSKTDGADGVDSAKKP